MTHHETWLDWLFSPLAWLVHWFEGELDQSLGTGFEGFLAIFVLSSVASFLGLAVTMFMVFFVLEKLDGLLKSIFRWSVEGKDLVVVQRGAEDYVAIASVVSQLRGLTGVRFGYPVENRKRPTTNNTHSVGKAATRFVLAVPSGVRSIVRWIIGWVRHPLGAYLFIGSVWLALRSEFDTALQSGQGVIAQLAEPTGLAVLAVTVAAAAFALDHGLTPRTRGRNDHQREQARRAETALSEMRNVANSLPGAINDVASELIAVNPDIMGSAVEHATDGDYTVDGDRVIQVEHPFRHPLSHSALGRHRGVNWEKDEPLRHYRSGRVVGLPTDHPWDPAAPVRTSFQELGIILRDPTDFHVVNGQAPRQSRELLWDVRRPPRNSVVDSTEDNRVTLCMSRTRLEQRGKRLIDDFARSYLDQDPSPQKDSVEDPTALSLGHLLKQALHDFEGDLWEICTAQAKVRRFNDAVDSWQNPRSWLRRLGTRTG
ncbi:hypothetical protein K0651_13105 [Ornithinimicrobium sp. Arc0846-15]|nr:hypothetical protein [Ornithinimicrobium laminariae]